MDSPLNTLWPNLTLNERTLIRRQCQRAVAVIRELGIYLQDAGRHNVLYARQSKKVMMLDFEHYGQYTPHHHRDLEAPELIEIFGASGLLDIRSG